MWLLPFHHCHVIVNPDRTKDFDEKRQPSSSLCISHPIFFRRFAYYGSLVCTFSWPPEGPVVSREKVQLDNGRRNSHIIIHLAGSQRAKWQPDYTCHLSPWGLPPPTPPFFSLFFFPLRVESGIGSQLQRACDTVRFRSSDSWVCCPGVEGHGRADRLAGKANRNRKWLTSRKILNVEELETLRVYSPPRQTFDRLEEGSVAKSSAREKKKKKPKKYNNNNKKQQQKLTGPVSKPTLLGTLVRQPMVSMNFLARWNSLPSELNGTMWLIAELLRVKSVSMQRFSFLSRGFQVLIHSAHMLVPSLWHDFITIFSQIKRQLRIERFVLRPRQYAPPSSFRKPALFFF